MRIRHLKYYIAVAEELSFTNAAKRVHIHPSPLAQAIRNIEQEFGTVLFEKLNGRLKMTWAGEVFLEEARRIIFLVNTAKSNVMSAGTGYRGRLRIALAHSLAQPLLTKLFAVCRAEEPLTGIRIVEMSIAEMTRALSNDEIDAGFTLHTGFNQQCYVKEAIWTDRLVLALPSRHTLLVHDKIPLSEVLKHPIVACHPERCAGGHDVVNRWLRESGGATEPIIAEYVSNHELMMMLVGAGYGLGLPLASQIALHANPDVVIRQAQEESVIVTTFIIRSDRTPSPTIETTAEPIVNTAAGMIQPETADALLATPRRRRLLEHIWQRTSLSRKQFDLLYLAPLGQFAMLVQQFPASESHHHAYLGGMLDHGLEIVAYALKLRQSYLLPTGSTPEVQAAQAEAWTAATAYAALLHDVGKVAVDLYVECADGTVWHPWHGPLVHPYRFRYHQEREYRLHGAATGLLSIQVLSPSIMDWLSGYRELWSPLLYVLAGQYEHAGILGELVIKADQASVAQALGGDPGKAILAPRHALQRKLLEGLRYLLREELKLNQPQASDGWLTEDTLWLVSKTVSDKLRSHLLVQGVDGIPANNTAVFNVLQDHGMLQPTESGKAIWRATITSSTGWSHNFTLLRLSPALIWEANERPAPFTGTVIVAPEEAQTPVSQSPSLLAVKHEVVVPPVSNSTIDEGAPDMMEDLLSMLAPGDETSSVTPANSPKPTNDNTTIETLAMVGFESATVAASISSKAPAPSGDHFIAWLRQGVQAHKLIINDAKALVHTIAGTVYLVSPGIFQRYAQEHLAVSPLAKAASLQDWVWVQKQFERLRLHRKQANGLNIWTCQITGPRKSRLVHGYLLSDPGTILAEAPFDNPYLNLLRDTATLSTQTRPVADAAKL